MKKMAKYTGTMVHNENCRAIIVTAFVNFVTCKKGRAVSHLWSCLKWSNLFLNCLKVNEITVGEDVETLDSSSLKISYKDYLPLWEFLLEKGRFKVFTWMCDVFTLREDRMLF